MQLIFHHMQIFYIAALQIYAKVTALCALFWFLKHICTASETKWFYEFLGASLFFLFIFKVFALSIK